MKYKLLYDLDVAVLEQKINEYLRNGWVLQGNLFILRAMLYQAVVKHPPKAVYDSGPG